MSRRRHQEGDTTMADGDDAGFPSTHGIDMPPQGTVTFRNQVTCVVVDAAALATNAETESTWPPPTVRNTPRRPRASLAIRP